MQQIKVGLPEVIVASLRQEAKDTGVSVSEVVRRRLIPSYENEVQEKLNGLKKTFELYKQAKQEQKSNETDWD